MDSLQRGRLFSFRNATFRNPEPYVRVIIVSPVLTGRACIRFCEGIKWGNYAFYFYPVYAGVLQGRDDGVYDAIRWGNGMRETCRF